MSKILLILIVVLVSTLIGISPVFAKTGLNSMCYIPNKSGAVLQGEHTKDLFEIASLSKVFTSYWALHELGAQYRFTTGIYVTAVTTDTADVHIAGSQDPFWGRQLTHFLISELYRVGVRHIRHLTFDENFKTRWSVLTSFEKPLSPTVEEISMALVSHFRDLAKEYPQTVQEASLAQIELQPASSMTVQSVSHVRKADFRKTSRTAFFTLRSSPLYRYLKEVNVVSNNHVADKLYDLLGGSEKFATFFQRELGLGPKSLQFINGSGNSVVIGNDPMGMPIKFYNKASCESLLSIVIALQNEVENKQKLRLTDVLAVSFADKGTMSPRYDGLPNAVIAKTGTVDPAVTMAGALSTSSGLLYFGILLKTDGAVDWEKARDEVRDQVYQWITNNGGPAAIPYEATSFLTFDANSAMTWQASKTVRP